MASGSNAPFSGEFVDLENVPKLPEGISSEQVLEQNSDVVRQVAEARFKAGLSQVNADGGFFDAYINTSKISSTSNLSITGGSDGKAKLGFNLVDEFDVENGLSNFFGDKETTTTAGEVIEGNQSGILTPSNQTLNLDPDDDGLNQILRHQVKVRILETPNNPDSFDKLEVKIQNGDFGNIGAKIKFRFPEKDIVLRNKSNNIVTLRNSFELGKVYTLDYDIDGANLEMDISINGVKELENEPVDTLDSRTFGGQEIICGNIECRSDGGNSKVVYDEIGSVDGLKQSGTVTEQEFTFTDTKGNAFSPSKVGIFPDQTLNGQSISYDLKDSSGSVVKTFNQADLNQLQSVSTTDTSFQIEANFSGNGSKTPELEFLDVRGV